MKGTQAKTPSDVIRAGYEALMTGDMPGLMACVAEDVVIDRPSLLLWGSPQLGRDYFANVLGSMAACCDFEITASAVFEGDGAEAVGVLSYTLTAHNSGEKLPITIVELFTVVDGLITRMDVYDKDPSGVAAFLARADAGRQQALA